MSFWNSELGALSGKAEDAFTRVFSVIPDGTMAIAKIKSFHHKDDVFEIDWELTAGDFKGQHVFQKIRAFDKDPKKRHKALNMLKYLFSLYQLALSHGNEPTDDDLKVFVGKHAGIKIQEWSMPKNDGGIMEGNFVSEVHAAANFQCVTGIKAEVVHNHLETAFSRNAQPKDVIEDDLPF